MISLSGFLYASNSSARQSVQLKVDDRGRVLIDGSDPVEWKCLEVSVRVGNSARYLQFPDGRRFETSCNEQIDQLEQAFGTNSSSRWLHSLESRLRYVVLALLLSIVMGAGFIRLGLPALAEQVAGKLPPTILVSTGQESLRLLDQHLFRATTLPMAKRAELQNMMQRLNQHLGSPYRLHLRDGGRIGANAFALPSGDLVVTDQLVRLSSHPDELMAVLAHEAGHVHHRHMARRVLQNSALALVISVVVGDLQAASGVLTALPTVALELQYSRDFELEADRFAAEVMGQMGIETMRLSDLLERMEQQASAEELPGWLRTHPMAEERRLQLMNN